MLTISFLWPSNSNVSYNKLVCSWKTDCWAPSPQLKDPSGTQESVLKNPFLVISDAGGPEIILCELFISWARKHHLTNKTILPETDSWEQYKENNSSKSLKTRLLPCTTSVTPFTQNTTELCSKGSIHPSVNGAPRLVWEVAPLKEIQASQYKWNTQVLTPPLWTLLSFYVENGMMVLTHQ